MPGSQSHRGCWNCKSIKIGCDQAFPACQNCLQSKKKCLGYALRLSWPRASDQRRAILLHPPTLPARQRLSSGRLRFINTSNWDIDLHNSIASTGSFHHHINFGRLDPRYSPPTIARPLSTPWGILEVGDQILLSYYETVLSRMVTTIDDDRNAFRHVLIKMALSDASMSSVAVLQAILAFSANHLSGSQAGAKHSVAAINALSSSMRCSTELRDRYRQLAASLVLTTYEVNTLSCFAVFSMVRFSYKVQPIAPLPLLLNLLLYVLMVPRYSTPSNRSGPFSSVARR